MSRVYQSCLLAAVILAMPVSAVRAQQPPLPCPQTDDPQAIVCAMKYGEKQSYWNACLAEQDGAYAVTPGECPRKSGTNN